MGISLFTILVPTHNRHKYLERLIDYYSSFPNVQVIIADSTESQYSKPIAKFEYHHLPNYGLQKKLNFLVEKCSTNFVVFCADDDFIVPDSISYCVNFLDINESYSAAQGAILYFKQLHKMVEFGRIYDQNLKHIQDEASCNRYNKLFQPFHTFFYAVHRKELLRKFFILSQEYSNLFMLEYLFNIFLADKGKLRELPILYQVREHLLDSGDKNTDALPTMLSNKIQYTEIQDALISICHNDKANAFCAMEALNSYSCHLQKCSEGVNQRKGKKWFYTLPFFGGLLQSIVQKQMRHRFIAKVIEYSDWKHLSAIRNSIKNNPLN